MADTCPRFQDAARALLAVNSLSEKEGQFCGGLAFRTAPLSNKQANWLRILLNRHGLLALAQGGEND
jgi:hypothetical protein